MTSGARALRTVGTLRLQLTHVMTDALRAYIITYSSITVLTLAVVAWRPGRFIICSRSYWRYLVAPWKLAFFMVVFSGIVFIAPYTGDPTWDYVDAGFMAVLAYTTGPWAVGVIYQVVTGQRPWHALLAPAVIWLFSASWSYDLYLLWRDGYYPVTWQSNLAASSILYLSAGLFWNLEKHPERGVIFGFMDEAWPEPEHNVGLAKVAPWVLLIALPVAAVLISFVL